MKASEVKYDQPVNVRFGVGWRPGRVLDANVVDRTVSVVLTGQPSAIEVKPADLHWRAEDEL